MTYHILNIYAHSTLSPYSERTTHGEVNAKNRADERPFIGGEQLSKHKKRVCTRLLRPGGRQRIFLLVFNMEGPDVALCTITTSIQYEAANLPLSSLLWLDQWLFVWWGLPGVQHSHLWCPRHQPLVLPDDFSMISHPKMLKCTC